jgi:DNA polymerase-3 subunit delta
MQNRGMQATREAVSLLADKVEGNLLAAAQEIDKLQLLHGSGRVDVEEVAAAVADSARFNIYGLVDSALAGKPDRMVRMLTGLRGEGIEPVLVSWAFTREVRSLEMMAKDIANGTGIEAVLAQQRVWERRKPLIRTALKRHSLAQWHILLQKCAQIDRVIKGVDIGQPWDELLQLGMWLSGEKYLRA